MTDQATPPPPPVQQAGAPVPPGDTAAPAKSSVAGGIVKRIIGAVVVFAVISIGGYAWKQFSGAPETAKVGDCLSGQSAETLKTVECTDAAAAYKVVGKIEGKTEAEFDSDDELSVCSAYPTTQTGFWEGEKGGKGYVLCLEPVS